MCELGENFKKMTKIKGIKMYKANNISLKLFNDVSLRIRDGVPYQRTYRFFSTAIQLFFNKTEDEDLYNITGNNYIPQQSGKCKLIFTIHK